MKIKSIERIEELQMIKYKDMIKNQSLQVGVYRGQRSLNVWH